MTRPIAIVLAAGKGTRMGSDRPKVLHVLAGRPLVLHVLDAARAAGVERAVVVVGHGAAQVEAAIRGAGGEGIEFALQAEQNGTGHAVMCALPSLEGHDGPVLILSGDVPLIRSETLERLVDACARSSAGLALLSFEPDEPGGYGRILRDPAVPERAVGIREHRDASEAELTIRECNAGVYCALAPALREVLPDLGHDNAAGEIYLTDLVEKLATRGDVLVQCADPGEVAGVNTPAQLAELEARLADRR